MPERVLRPEGKGFLFLDAHPAGCALTVEEMAAEAGRQRAAAGPERRALVIGCSAGYGLAAAVTGLFGYGAATIGLCYERPATARRSASAGWYRTAALAGPGRRRRAARSSRSTGTASTPRSGPSVLDRVAATLGPLDVLIYSVAAPRRTDPRTGTVYHSAVQADRRRLPGQERGIRRRRRAARVDAASPPRTRRSRPPSRSWAARTGRTWVGGPGGARACWRRASDRRL